MKLPEKYFEELAKEILGEDVLPLIQLIKEKENVSEFKIAERLNISINQVRNILYRLNEYDLVSSTRKKDKKKGWYIYFWTFDTIKARNVLTDHKKRKINLLTKMINEETGTLYYICPNNCMRLDNELALEHQFKCPECNSLLKEENKERRIESMKNQVNRLTLELQELTAHAEEQLHISEKKAKKPLKKTKKSVLKKTQKHKSAFLPLKKESTFLKHQKISLLKKVRKKIFRR